MSDDYQSDHDFDWHPAIRHGERADSEMCICGHESYLTCPNWPQGGIAGIDWDALTDARLDQGGWK